MCQSRSQSPCAFWSAPRHRLWNNQFPETKILGLPVSRRMHGLVYMASRDQVDVDAFHKDIQYKLEKLGKSKFGFGVIPQYLRHKLVKINIHLKKCISRLIIRQIVMKLYFSFVSGMISWHKLSLILTISACLAVTEGTFTNDHDKSILRGNLVKAIRTFTYLLKLFKFIISP